ncbi:DUF3592 domain-containing protein, partial [Akkermansia sp.]
LIFIIATFYISLLLVFGKLHIVLDHFKIVIDQYVLGIRMASKQIPLSGDTRIILESGPSGSNAHIFKNNGKVQVFPMAPVVYSIKIQEAGRGRSEVVLSSGNYSLVLKLFRQISSLYPELTAEIDTSSEKRLLDEYRKRINSVKKRSALALSLLCFFGTILTGLPLSVEYVNYKYSRHWVEIQGRVEEMQKSEHKDGFRVAYSWKGKKLYTSLYEKSFLSHQHGENAMEGNLVRLYVNPEDPEQYTFGSSILSSMIGLIICFCLLLLFSLLLFCAFLKLRKTNLDHKVFKMNTLLYYFQKPSKTIAFPETEISASFERRHIQACSTRTS